VQDYRKVQEQYALRLRRALELAAERWPIDGLRLNPIDPAALAAFQDGWREHWARMTDWDWAEAEHRTPKGFNVAIWHNDELCGLASGKLTGSKALRLDYLEGRPGGHPLKGQIIPLVLTCADAYRILTGSKELKLYDVWEPLVPVYKDHGFELAPESGRVHVMRRKTK